MPDSKTNLDKALDSIKRIGTFSEGEKIALVKAMRLAMFPGDWSVDSATNDQILQYNSTTSAWENTTPTFLTPLSSIGALADVDISSIADGHVLTWDNGNSLWRNIAPAVTSVNGYTGAVILDMADTTPTSTKGDLIVDDGTTVTFLGVGTNDQVLTADSTQPTGIKWADAAGNPEGTAVLSTGETGATKFLREDGDGTCSWQAIPGGGDALTASPLSQFAATTSAQLAGVITNETGSGALVFATSPTLVTPALGTPASGNLSNCTNVQLEGTALKATGEVGGSKFLREDGDGTCSWQNVPAAGSPEGTDVLSTGPVTDGYVLTADGLGGAVWEAASGGGSSTFISLTDTPSAWTGSANKNVVVNGTGDGLIFGDAPVTSIGVTAPIATTGGTTPTISITAATTGAAGSMSASDKTKLDSIDSNSDSTELAITGAGDTSAVMDFSADRFVILDGGVLKTAPPTYIEQMLDNYLIDGVTAGSGLTGGGSNGTVTVTLGTPGTCTGSTTNSVTSTSHTHIINSLDASDVSSGIFNIARIPTGTASDECALGNHGHSDLGALDSTPTFSGQCAALSFKATSARKKKNILGHEGEINVDAVLALSPVIYSMKDDESQERQIGLIADEVAPHYPEICSFDEDGNATGIDYSRLVIPLLLKVRELEAKING